MQDRHLYRDKCARPYIVEQIPIASDSSAKSNKLAPRARCLVDDVLVTRQRSETGDLRERRARFIAAAHFLQDVGEQNILARLIRLTANRPALSTERFLQMILPQFDQRKQMQRFGIMHIEPAGMRQRSVGSGDIARFRVKTSERDGCSVVP